jgi:hypothetical protein
MKKNFILLLIICLAVSCSCQKQPTEEERNAEIERQVEQRLASERQARTEQELAERQAELAAREKALAEKQQATAQAASTVSVGTPLRAAQPTTASYSTFYTKLEPYGVWRETSNYGFVWQPYESERSRTWRPYTNGRWVYTDAGWTWVSEEPFGWAAYHYGRWTRLRNIGWVWVPGEEWAPAWVSWRKGNDYVGWAPLPPEARFDRRTGIQNWADNYYDIGPEQYCFVPTNEFGARRVETVVVPSTRNVTIVNQTTNVTNLTYNNVTVVNQGPSYDELRAHVRQPVERLRLERQTSINVEAEITKPVIRGEVIEMPAPVITRGQPIDRPRNVKEKVAQTIVERGWEGITDQQAAQKAREKIKSESTPPPNAPPKTLVKPAEAATAETSPPISPPAFGSSTAPPVLASSPRPAATAPSVAPRTPLRSPGRSRPAAGTASSATPFRRATPVATATRAPATSSSPTPAPTVSVRPTATPPPFTRTAPEISASPSLSPGNSRAMPSSPPFNRSAESREQRRTAQELKEKKPGAEEKLERRNVDSLLRESPATAVPQTFSKPSISSSPAEPAKKAEKQKHKRERAGISEGNENILPSPSVAPE